MLHTNQPTAWTTPAHLTIPNDGFGENPSSVKALGSDTHCAGTLGPCGCSDDDDLPLPGVLRMSDCAVRSPLASLSTKEVPKVAAG